MKKELDFYRYVSYDKARRFMQGVYHKDGYKWATNGTVMVKVKADYPEKFENKIVSKELTYIDGQFPNCSRVIPEMSDMHEITDLSPNEVILKEFKALKSLFSIHKKISNNWISFRYVLPNHSVILFEVWEKVIHFMECYPDAKLYCHKDETTNEWREANKNSLMLVSGNSLMVFMPAQNYETDSLGYQWEFNSASYERHDEFDFFRVLRYVSAKGIEERYKNGNLTDKDNKIIDNLYRYLELVGYDYKREVA